MTTPVVRKSAKNFKNQKNVGLMIVKWKNSINDGGSEFDNLKEQGTA